ncbi:hypothetical protein BCR43DRAFT_346051 [Syncephalastrum racemosum]|uniref:CUE domain-containing protein n=1 Tax=Syncephalastrum racemosum TaxID=13706 RepID=A0A1X2H5Q0_SYNRA|nr:hypothetical protein BCR43DRAFT_346051 [Syncephalastrum racemosum]
MPNPFLTNQLDTLKEAFPTLDLNIIEHVLDSHNGHVEPAFETLLGMTDPSISTSNTPTSSCSRQQQQSQQQPPPPPPRNEPRHSASTSNLAFRAHPPAMNGRRTNSNDSATNLFYSFAKL